jgi:D-sedoheptulose 7-phosphate isomerase
LASTELASRVRALLQASIDLKKEVMDQHSEVIVRMAEKVSSSLQNGGKVLLCGNGGSAADAQHLATELLIRLRSGVDRDGLPALALATDTSSMTACANDYSFEHYYERMTCALGRPGDVLIGISTSGRSENIVRALSAARRKRMVSMGLLGGDGGGAVEHCDIALVVPSAITGRVQEAHIAIGHALMELVEDLLLEAGYLKTRAEAR